MRVLVVEDNADLASNVGDYLTLRGHRVDYAANGRTGLQLAASNAYDAVVLDVMLPGLDGVTVCRRLRSESQSNCAVLMLTARDTLDDRVEGLDAGADDYLVKPFALRELEARLRAVVRRGPRIGAGRTLRVADLVLDLDTLLVERGGRRIDLTPTELTLLETLMRAAPAVVGRDALEHAIWGDSPPASDALRLHVHGLREAIDRDFATPLLRTARGRGWALDGAVVPRDVGAP
ncbi:MAG: response regulator transcription factor [Ectothiorhodospiraceae bacterium]|nr:response regulator transcription factor [Chromatiales bacterium]MCP5153685.1 response regulator transcription factor [Ectothiorhodospiraceae bacterium]